MPLKVRRIDTLTLGCTHYPLLKKTIQRKIGRRVFVVDSAAAVADDLHAFSDGGQRPAADPAPGGRLRLFVFDRTDPFEKIAHMILDRKLPLAVIEHPLSAEDRRSGENAAASAANRGLHVPQVAFAHWSAGFLRGWEGVSPAGTGPS